jgi:hypothetical protein
MHDMFFFHLIFGGAKTYLLGGTSSFEMSKMPRLPKIKEFQQARRDGCVAVAAAILLLVPTRWTTEKMERHPVDQDCWLYCG